MNFRINYLIFFLCIMIGSCSSKKDFQSPTESINANNTEIYNDNSESNNVRQQKKELGGNQSNNISNPPEDNLPEDNLPDMVKTDNCASGKIYEGFGGRILNKNRQIMDEESEILDVTRIKPYQVLAKEYARVTGFPPLSLERSAESFGAQYEDYYIEQESSALVLIALYNAAFEASVKMVEQGTYPENVSEINIQDICLSFTREAWSREPSLFEMNHCESFLSVSQETSYLLASILSSAGFISY